MQEARVYLEQVLKKLNDQIQELEKSISQGQREVEGMHEYYWENYTEMDQYGYENFDNQQALLSQVNANQELLLKQSRLRKLLDSPYFGRVDFRYEGEDEAEVFYIGIGSFSERKGAIPLIYDWRAPVSSLFYDYDQGSASYEAPGGTMEGEITSKWQYKIRGSKLIYAFESDMKIDDEVLRHELGSGGDVRLKNIIRTIQREQNQIIRNTKDRIMVIQGVAGSGKTSVALHRIAYLLYHDREHLKSRNVLILSPNSVFSDYISHILPELGEENIREMSFDLFAYRELKDVVSDCEDRYDQIERKLQKERMEAGVIRKGKRSGQDSSEQKNSSQFLSDLREYVLFAEDELMQFSDFKYKKFSREAREIMELFYYKFPDIPLLSRMDSVIEYYVDEFETLTGRDFEEDELETIRQKFYRMYRTRDLYLIYRDFLQKYDYGMLPGVPYEKRVLEYEDVYPMLYMKYLLFTHSQHRQIRHLVIDEMQDYSYLQYLILAELFHCKMTILGDRAQTMDTCQADVMKFLPRVFGRDLRTVIMNKSYRNTVEIASYANEMLKEEMELFERHGDPVGIYSVTDREAAVTGILELCRKRKDDNPFETAAVLTATEEEAWDIYMKLKDRLTQEEMPVSYIDRDSSLFRKGLTITTFYLAKGLEFDEVYSVFSEKTKEAPLHRQAEYISATRAMHALSVFYYQD